MVGTESGPPELRAVCFDYFDTLVAHRRPTVPHAEQLGLVDEYTTVWRDWGRRRQTSRTSYRALLLAVYERAGQEPDLALVDTLCEDRRTRQKDVLMNPDARILDLLEQCRSAALPIAVVSNAAEEDVAAWGHSPFAPLVDAPVFSFEVGTVKPDQRILEEALRRLGLPAISCAFVSDSVSDLVAADAAGFAAGYRAAWFVDKGSDSGRPVPWTDVHDPTTLAHLIARNGGASL